MLERRIFKNYLNKIINTNREMESMLSALDPYGFRIDEIPCFSRMFDIAVGELQRLVHDENDTIFYYICELNCGESESAEYCISRPATHEAWSLRNPDELYDYLEQMYNEGKKV